MAFDKSNQFSTKTATAVVWSNCKRPEQADRAKEFEPDCCTENGFGANSEEQG